MCWSCPCSHVIAAMIPVITSVFTTERWVGWEEDGTLFIIRKSNTCCSMYPLRETWMTLPPPAARESGKSASGIIVTGLDHKWIMSHSQGLETLQLQMKLIFCCKWRVAWRERHIGDSLLPLAVLETSSVFELSRESQASIHMIKKKWGDARRAESMCKGTESWKTGLRNTRKFVSLEMALDS